jgi:hypothetical protein
MGCFSIASSFERSKIYSELGCKFCGELWINFCLC